MAIQLLIVYLHGEKFMTVMAGFTAELSWVENVDV